MTNIVATLVFVTVTNWVTVSKTIPVCDKVGCLVIHYTTLHQVGTVTTNLVARVEWKGKTSDAVLEQGQISTIQVGRDVLESPYGALQQWTSELSK